MQIERNVSVLVVVLSGAVLVPQYVSLAHGTDYWSNGVMALGTGIGTFAVLLGGGVALGREPKRKRYPILALWTLIALAMGAGAVVAAARNPGWGWRTLLVLIALLPPAAIAFVWRADWREERLPARPARPAEAGPRSDPPPADEASPPVDDAEAALFKLAYVEGRCPECGGATYQVEKSTFTGREMRDYACRACPWTHTFDCGPALWQVLSDAKDEPDPPADK